MTLRVKLKKLQQHRRNFPVSLKRNTQKNLQLVVLQHFFMTLAICPKSSKRQATANVFLRTSALESSESVPKKQKKKRDEKIRNLCNTLC